MKPTLCPIGVHTLALVGTEVANFLGYTGDEAKKYTSHTYRRSGATIMAEQGASLEQLKVAGNWSSTASAEGYIQNSDRFKRNVADFMAEDPTVQNELPTSKKAKYVSDEAIEVKQKQAVEQLESKPAIMYQNVYHITGNASFGNGFQFSQPFETSQTAATIRDGKVVPKIIFSKKVVNSCI